MNKLIYRNRLRSTLSKLFTKCCIGVVATVGIIIWFKKSDLLFPQHDYDFFGIRNLFLMVLNGVLGLLYSALIIETITKIVMYCFEIESLRDKELTSLSEAQLESMLLEITIQGRDIDHPEDVKRLQKKVGVLLSVLTDYDTYLRLQSQSNYLKNRIDEIKREGHQSEK